MFEYGGVGGDESRAVIDGTRVVSIPLSRLRKAWEGWLPDYMNG
jgi:hypothetical protein